jgi:Host cell surface-exposed lipoprotein
VGADWREEAAKSAKDYLNSQSFSKQGLIVQLSSSAGEGFTLAQARYGVNKAYR